MCFTACSDTPDCDAVWWWWSRYQRRGTVSDPTPCGHRQMHLATEQVFPLPNDPAPLGVRPAGTRRVPRRNAKNAAACTAVPFRSKKRAEVLPMQGSRL